MGHDVFISHASGDREVAEAACKTLEQRALRCWIAPRDIHPGQDYGEAIIDGIHSSRLFVLIFSAEANESKHVRREVERASARGITIIPFRVEDVPPSKTLEYFISSAHWLDAVKAPIQPHLDYLADVASQKGGSPAPLMREARPAPRVGWRWLAGGAAALAAIVLLGLYFRAPVPSPEPAVASRAPTDELRMKIRFPGESERIAARDRAVPDVSRTIFRRRAVPVRSDKPLRLRAEPSATARSIAVIGPDEVFRVAPRQGEWWPARLRNGTEGFVQGRWVNVLDNQRAGGPGG